MRNITLDKSIDVTKANKGRLTVFLDKHDYVLKFLALF